MSSEAREYQKIVRIHGRDSKQAREFLAEHNGDWQFLNEDAPSIESQFEKFANLTNLFKSINPNELSSENPGEWERASEMFLKLSKYFDLGKIAIAISQESKGTIVEVEYLKYKMNEIYESLPVWIQW